MEKKEGFCPLSVTCHQTHAVNTTACATPKYHLTRASGNGNVDPLPGISRAAVSDVPYLWNWNFIQGLTCTFRVSCYSTRLSWALVLTWVSPFVPDKAYLWESGFGRYLANGATSAVPSKTTSLIITKMFVFQKPIVNKSVGSSGVIKQNKLSPPQLIA